MVHSHQQFIFDHCTSFAPYREEVAESDVWKNLVGSVFPALALALLPKLLQMVMQTAGGTQVKSILLRDWVIQRGIVAVGVQPEIKSISQRVKYVHRLLLFPVVEGIHSRDQKKEIQTCCSLTKEKLN